MSSRRYLSRQRLNILDLNVDVLDSIFDLVSVQDACKFRLCSQRAAQAAARRAMSSKAISIVTQRWLDFMMERREKLAFIQKLTLVFPTTHQIVTSDLSFDFVEFLQAASGVKHLALNTPAETFGQIPRFPQIIARFSLLQALELPNSGSETSAWILGETHPFSSRLTRLYLGELNFPSSDVYPVRPLSVLRSLSVKSLSGHLEYLVQFAPHIVQLELVADCNTHRPAPCVAATSVVPAAPSHVWQSLLHVVGPLQDVHRVLSLFQHVDRLVLTHHCLQATEQHVITETLRRTQPCCLELEDDADDFPFVCYRPLPHIAMRLFYLRIKLPSQTKQCLNEFYTVAKQLTSLLCLDIDLYCHVHLDNSLGVHSLHYISCKIPSLRFILVKQHKLWDKEHQSAQTPTSLGVCDFFMSGVRLSHRSSPLEEWVKGRIIGTLLPKTAERVRNAYCHSTFERRLDVEEHLFPGPLPDMPSVGVMPGAGAEPRMRVCFAQGDDFDAPYSS